MSIESTIEFIDTPQRAATPRREVARRPLLRVVARDAAVLCVLLLVSEIALQLFAPVYGHDYYDRTLTASQPVTFNADGFRGPAVPMEKRTSETRILALGDSTTFGTGASIEQTWPMQLRDLLATNHHPANAMNVALQGASLADMTLAYEQKWAAYKPDVVTVLVSSNMISLAWMNRNRPPQMPPYITHAESPSTLKERIAREAGRLCLPHFLSVNSQRALFWLGVTDHRIADPHLPFGALLAHGWRQGDLPASEAEEAWNCFAHELQGLRDATARRGVKLVVGFSPCRFDLTDTLFDNEKNVPRDRITIQPAERLGVLCREQGIACIDTVKALRNAREQSGRSASLYIMFDYNHLDANGHGAVARAMRDVIAPLVK